MLNLAFFSSSPLSLPLLEKLNRDFSVKLVITNPDRAIGRKQEMTPSVLKTWAIRNNVNFLTPSTLKDGSGNEINSKIQQLNIDLAIVIDYGLLIPKTVFTAPKFQTVNIHFSPLPKYRGPFPDAFVVLNNEKETAVSYVLIDEGFDTGDVLAREKVEVDGFETAGQLHEKLYKRTVFSISYIINSWARWNLDKNYNRYNNNKADISLFLPPKKQNQKDATYTKMLSRDDGFIDWKILQKILGNEKISYDGLPELVRKYAVKKSSKIFNFSFLIFNLFRALTPWPGIWTLIKLKTQNTKLKSEEKRLKILKAHLENDQFTIDEVQLEGKNPTTWEQFKKAYDLT